MKVMKMEGKDAAKDPLLKSLMEAMKDTNSTLQVNTRTGGDQGPKITKKFQDRVREVLSFSGVDAVLPLDCGRVSVVHCCGGFVVL